MTKKLISMLVLTSAVGFAAAETKTAPTKGPAPAAGTKPAPAAGAAKPTPAPAPMKPAPVPAETKTTPPAGDAMMTPPKPGPETMALGILAGGGSWTGKTMAGAMGPGSPEMDVKGSASCKWVLNKLVLQCNVKETMGTGKTAMKMEGVMHASWDFSVNDYRATWADNMGGTMLMKGKMEGTKFSLESLGDFYMMMGQPMKMRITWDWTDPKAATLTTEMAMGKGGKWMTGGVSTIKGLKVPKAAK